MKLELDKCKTLDEKRAEIERYRQAVSEDLSTKGKIASAKPVCNACGGYVQIAAKYLSQKYQEELYEPPYCIYCLSNLMGRSVDELKLEYSSEK